MELSDLKHFIGIDLSATRAGVIIMDIDGKVIKSFYVTALKKYLTGDATSAYLPPRPTKMDKGIYAAYRRCQMAYHAFLASEVTCSPLSVIALEDYAYGATGRGMFEVVEISGLLRNHLWREDIPLRMIDPMSMQMWALKGGCTKLDRIQAAEKAGYKIPETLYTQKAKKGDVDGPGTDLADAYWLADMLRVEVLVRLGKVTLAELNQRQRDIFNRVTKAYPVNLLNRPFVWRQDEQVKTFEEKLKK